MIINHTTQKTSNTNAKARTPSTRLARRRSTASTTRAEASLAVGARGRWRRASASSRPALSWAKGAGAEGGFGGGLRPRRFPVAGGPQPRRGSRRVSSASGPLPCTFPRGGGASAAARQHMHAHTPTPSHTQHSTFGASRHTQLTIALELLVIANNSIAIALELLVITNDSIAIVSDR